MHSPFSIGDLVRFTRPPESEDLHPSREESAANDLKKFKEQILEITLIQPSKNSCGYCIGTKQLNLYYPGYCFEAIFTV